MTNNPESVGKLFEHAIELERAAQSLYSQFENKFSNYPDVALFWKKYALEEDGHAAYLERIGSEVEQSRLSSPADKGMVQKVHRCLRDAAQIKMEKIKTLEDAYQVATELENSETNAIFEFMIVNFSTDELAKSHQFLRTQLSTHIARLENDFPGQYKSKLARQQAFALK